MFVLRVLDKMIVKIVFGCIFDEVYYNWWLLY